MSILETAIKAEGSVGKLASALAVRQNVISNWRARGIPKPWELVLEMKYAQPPDIHAQAATETVATQGA